MLQDQLPGYTGPGVFYPRDSERSGGEEFLLQSQEGRDVSRHVLMSSRIPIQQLDDVVYAYTTSCTPTYTLPKRNPATDKSKHGRCGRWSYGCQTIY
jgi:hypothetical protein